MNFSFCEAVQNSFVPALHMEKLSASVRPICLLQMHTPCECNGS